MSELANRGDEYLVATWPRYESVIAAMGPIGVVTFFGPIMAILLIIGAIVILPQLFENVMDLAGEGDDFLTECIPGWEPFTEAVGIVLTVICALPVVPFVLGLAGVGALVEYLRETGRIE